MVGEKRKKRACAVDGRARAARRTSCLSRCPESHAYVVVKESSGLIFIVHHRVRGRRRRKGRGTPAGAKVTARSRRGGRCGTMRWGSHGYKIGINESNRLSSGRFSISIMNLGAHRPATDEANETLAACVEYKVGYATPCSWLLARNFERSHGESDVRHEAPFGLENNLSSSCHQRSLVTEKAPRDADERPPA